MASTEQDARVAPQRVEAFDDESLHRRLRAVYRRLDREVRTDARKRSRPQSVRRREEDEATIDDPGVASVFAVAAIVGMTSTATAGVGEAYARLRDRILAASAPVADLPTSPSVHRP